MSTLIEATIALHTYLKQNDKVDGFTEDHARMLAREAAIPVDPTPKADEPHYCIGFETIERKHEVVASLLHDTFHYAQNAGFDRSSSFQSLWDQVILAAIAEGYPIANI